MAAAPINTSGRHLLRESDPTPTIASLLPKHIATELNSRNMGMLSEAGLRDPQQLASDKKITVTLDKIVSEVITLRCFRGSTYTSEQHTLLMCNTIYDIFTGDSTSDTDAVRIFLQALIMIFGRQVLISISAESMQATAGLKIEMEEIDETNEQEMNDLRQDPDTVDCMQVTGVVNLANPQVTLIAYCGAVLLLVGKQLIESSLLPWTFRRVRGLADSMGSTVEIARVASFNLITAGHVYQKLCMLRVVPLRAATVRVLFGTTGVGSKVAAISGAMLNLLAWSEMNHIRMVQDYLFGRFPEILAMKQLQGSTIGLLKTAWEPDG